MVYSRVEKCHMYFQNYPYFDTTIVVLNICVSKTRLLNFVIMQAGVLSLLKRFHNGGRYHPLNAKGTSTFQIY
jgi:hypothetical protein